MFKKIIIGTGAATVVGNVAGYIWDEDTCNNDNNHTKDFNSCNYKKKYYYNNYIQKYKYDYNYKCNYSYKGKMPPEIINYIYEFVGDECNCCLKKFHCKLTKDSKINNYHIVRFLINGRMSNQNSSN